MRKSSRTCDRNCVSALVHSMRRPTCWSGDFFFKSTTMKSGVRLGLQYEGNLVANKHTNFKELKTLFEKTLRLIVEQSSEILDGSTMKNTHSLWMRATLCHDHAIKWANAKVHVNSDSVSCLGKMYLHWEANEKWKSQITELQQSNEYGVFSGNYGEPIEFEWKISQDSHRLAFSQRFRKIWRLHK